MSTPAHKQVKVELSARLVPDARRVWDDAHALGLALLGRHRSVSSCTIAVHARRRDSLRWRIDREAWLGLHWALTPHPDAVLDVLDGDEVAWKRLRTRLPTPLPPKTQPKGQVHDLADLMQIERQIAVDLALPEAPSVAITWGRYGRPPRRGLRLGSCEPSDPPLVRIHPVLDDESVPAWFIGFVLFHELLHVIFPPEQGDTSRRSVHTEIFREAERRHPRYLEATAWETSNLTSLLARCRNR